MVSCLINKRLLLLSITNDYYYYFICLFTDLFSDAVNDYVGFGLMDAKQMVDVAVKWKRVPSNITCTIPRHNVNR